MKRPIAPGLSPNTEKKDVIFALKTIFSPWTFFGNSNILSLEKWFKEYFGVACAISFASGRASLFGVLKAFDIKQGDEILIQSFTCVVVPNAIIAIGAKPVFVDVSKDLTIDTFDLEKKITKKSKAIIVQHTFGVPADMKRIMAIAHLHNLYVIEDSAHVLGRTTGGTKLGSIGDAGFFSFGRDKAFSSVFGGMVITSNKTLGKKIKKYQEKLENPSFLWTMQQLFHPITFYFALPVYLFFSFGKVIVFCLQKMHILSFPVSIEEKNGKQSKNLIKKMPNNLAGLALLQLKKIKRYNSTRETFVKMYINAFNRSKFSLPYKKISPLLRFPLLVEKREEILKELKEQNIYLGTWYSNQVDPIGTDFSKINYNPKNFPKTKAFSQKIINLPTYPTLSVEDVKRVIKLLSKYAKN